MSNSTLPPIQSAQGVAYTTKKATLIHEKTIQRLNWLATKMDSAFQIPGTSRTIGFDSLIGLIPGVGDAITGLISAEFVRQAYKLGARKRTMFKMTTNVLLDLLFGSIPLLGDIFDFAFKANSKNVQLLKQEFQSEIEGSRSASAKR